MYKADTRRVISGIGAKRVCGEYVEIPGRDRLLNAQEEAKMLARRNVRVVERVVIEVRMFRSGK